MQDLVPGRAGRPDARALAARMLTRAGSARDLLPVADQALISAGNFGSGVIAARALGHEAFGVWVLANLFIWLMLPIQAGLIHQPLVLNGTPLDDRSFGRFLRATAVWLAAFSALSALLVTGIAL